jgi:hypothetical protein
MRWGAGPLCQAWVRRARDAEDRLASFAEPHIAVEGRTAAALPRAPCGSRRRLLARTQLQRAVPQRPAVDLAR